MDGERTSSNRGQFKPGFDPRRNLSEGGRPPDILRAGASLARKILDSQNAEKLFIQLLKEKDPWLKLAVLKYLFDHGYGKATQPIEAELGGATIPVVLDIARRVFARGDSTPADVGGPASDAGSPGAGAVGRDRNEDR